MTSINCKGIGLFNFQLHLRGGLYWFFFLMGIGTHLTQLTAKVTPFKQLKQVKHSNTDPRSGQYRKHAH